MIRFTEQEYAYLIVQLRKASDATDKGHMGLASRLIDQALMAVDKAKEERQLAFASCQRKQR